MNYFIIMRFALYFFLYSQLLLSRPVPFLAKISIYQFILRKLLIDSPLQKYLECCKYEEDKITIILGVPLPQSFLPPVLQLAINLETNPHYYPSLMGWRLV